MHVPSYGLPDDQTLVTYLEVIYRVVIEARAAARSGDAKRAAALTDAVHNLPELLTRWPEVDEDMIWKLLDGIVERDQFGSWADCVPP